MLKLIPESKSKVVYKPLPKDDPERRRPDISLAKKILNWEPKVGLEEGLKRAINILGEKRKHKFFFLIKLFYV